MMKIAIIGFGWLGLPLGKSLLEKGHEILGTTTTFSKIEMLENLGFSARLLDFSNELTQQSNLFFEKTEICILNFPPKRKNSDPNIQYYGEQLLKAIQPFSDKTKFIFVSSTGIYPESISIAKEDELDRLSIANINQLAYAEEVLHQKLGDRLTIVRMAGLIGEDRQIAKYFAGKTAIPNGKSPVNLIHQIDCVGIISKIIETNFWGEIFNACASIHPSREEYYTFSCAALNLQNPTFISESNPSISKIVDNSKSKTVLSYQYQLDNPLDFVQY